MRKNKQEESKISDLMDTTMQKIRDMIGANAIVGDPIKTDDGVTLIPVSKVSFGFAGGGSEFGKNPPPSARNFGGGTGAGAHITPICFIVAKGQSVEVVYINPPSAVTGTVDRIIDKVPEVIDKITDLLEKDE